MDLQLSMRDQKAKLLDLQLSMRDELKGLREENAKLLDLQLLRESKEETHGSGNCLHIYGGSSRGTMPFTAVA